MKTEKKFFDGNDNEVDPSRAVKCVELTYDVDGRLVKSVTYFVDEEKEE